MKRLFYPILGLFVVNGAAFYLTPTPEPIILTSKVRTSDLDFEVVRVYDGDTIICNIQNVPDVFGKEIGVRVYGIDCPEKNSDDPKEVEDALKSKAFVEKWLDFHAESVKLRNVRRDKYFRLLADVVSSKESLSEEILERKLGVEYYGGPKD